MKGIRKWARMSQTSAHVKDTQPKPTLPGVERIEEHPFSFGSRQIDQPPAGNRTIHDWIQEIPSRYSDINGGVMKELMSLALRYINEFQITSENHQGAVMEHQVLEQRKRLSLLADGERDLDQRLAGDPEVREQFVSDLTALVLVLSTGISFFRPEYQHRLVEDTHRLVEQASKLASHHLDRPNPPLDVLGFINATMFPIKSRIDRLHALLPTIQHLVEPFDETKSQQVGGVVFDNRKTFDPGMMLTKVHQKVGQLRPRRSRPPSHIIHSNLSDISKNQSHGSSNSRSIPSIFSTRGTHSSLDPLTDTATSSSPSEFDQSTSEPKDPNPTGASSSYSKCKTTSVDAAVMDDCVSHTSIHHQQLVQVWLRNGSPYKYYLALLDTGSNESFVSSSVVKEQDLDAERIVPKTVNLLDNKAITVNELVKPKWQFSIGSKQHDNFGFYVVSNLPLGLDMVLGNKILLELGISLSSSRSALVAHADNEELSTLKEQQQKGERQARDASANDAKWQQYLKARHEELVKEKAAANAAIRDRTPQKAVTWSGGEQRR